jgi:ATP-dependent helicase/nuclease subunit B
MPITRKFLDWSRPALTQVADHLAVAYHDGEVADLSAVVVVLPGRKACRRLLELLVDRTDSRVSPPQIITEGQFPELLYEPQRPFAGHLVQQLAWGEAVRRLPRPTAERVMRDLPHDGDVDGWIALGELLWKLHRELAADQLDFGDVVREGDQVSGFGERLRWEALHAAQQEYLGILDGLGLWDRQTARLVAIDQQECCTDRDIVLVGTVDLNRSTRAMLDQVADRVTALIHAPQSLSERFDGYGCIRPDAWARAEIDIADEQLHVAEGPSEQADEVVRVLSSFDGQYRADDITIGVADDGLVAQLSRRLRQYDVPARWVVGKTLAATALLRLLAAVADYLDDRRADRFAVLVRHPDVGAWLKQRGIDDDWLSQLDEYRVEHLPGRLGFWLGSADKCAAIRRACECIAELLAELNEPPRPLAEWSEAIIEVPLTIFAEGELDPEVLKDRAEIEAFTTLQSTLAEHADLPEALAPVVSGAQAIRLTLERLERGTVPPPRDDAAVELLGWLELPLEDTPVLIVTSFNEPYVPSSVDADLFLPNRLRQHLGIIDNDRRCARDSYALSSMLASRERVVLIAARRDGRGDPLLPSRLGLACEPEAIARRIEAFFEPRQVPHPLPAFGAVAVIDGTTPINQLVVPRPRPLDEPKRVLSVTSFRDYLLCPYRYYLRHVLGLGAMDDDVEELSGADFGNLLHDVLADFGRSDLKDSTDAGRICEDLVERFQDLARRRFGNYRPAAVAVQIEQAMARLEAFAAWQAGWAAQGWSITMVEQPEGNVPVPFPIDGGRSIWLRGRIDRIDRHADGRWALLDYKSGEKGEPPEKTHRCSGEWVDLQLPLYRHLARSLSVEGDVLLGYITLPADVVEVKDQMAHWSAAELDDAEARAREIAGKILDEVFLPLNGDDPPNLADYASICQEGVLGREGP